MIVDELTTMRSQLVKSQTVFAIVVVCLLAFGSLCPAQNPGGPQATSSDSRPESQQQSSSYSSPDIDAERQQIWSSDEMLEARAWLEDHFRRSAQISDAEAKKYMAELKAMSPDQMRIWLINFHREHDRQVQEGQRWRQLNRQKVQHQKSNLQVGGFRNPYGGQRRASSGLPAAGMRQTIGGQSSPFAPRHTVQKPFSSPSYQQSIRPLVTSEDAARTEILRGLGPWRW